MAFNVKLHLKTLRNKHFMMTDGKRTDRLVRVNLCTLPVRPSVCMCVSVSLSFLTYNQCSFPDEEWMCLIQTEFLSEKC